MAYESIRLKTEINIEKVISIHYFEYMSDFSFAGESHNFWELLCVDKGIVNVVADTATYALNRGDIIFHKPNEFHNVEANGVTAPNLVVIGFECYSPAMRFFANKILRIGETERTLLAQIIREARGAFSSRLDDPYCEKLLRRDSSPFACEQLIKMHLQEVLIHLKRTFDSTVAAAPPARLIRQKGDKDLFQRIVGYMEDNIGSQITIDQVCRDNLVGRSILQKTFREHTASGVIDYFSKMKINMAKQLIREQHMNFTQIADRLGYTSIHYFSRQFKKITGMTPTEYATSIKLISEGGAGDLSGDSALPSNFQKANADKSIPTSFPR